MLKSLASAWKIKELRQKIIFTLLMFLVFRIGAHIPVPGIDRALIGDLFSSDIFGFLDIVSGGSLKSVSIFAMGIIPYINASIIVQLLTMVVPYFEKLQKEGTEGRKKMTQIIRFSTAGLALLQAIGMAFYMKNYLISGGYMIPVIITLTAGTMFLMWIGEQITDKGIGNGISLIILAGIVSKIPSGAIAAYQYLVAGTLNIFMLLLLLAAALLIIAGVVCVQEGQRQINVQYAKRVVGRKVYGGQSTHIPMKVNQAGVIPIIFASSFLLLPATIAGFFPNSGFAQGVVNVLSFDHPVYMILYSLLIIVFTYFYTAATFNTNDVADNLKKYGGFVPGLRPGKPTAEYLDKILSRLTFAGGIFLVLIALMPNLAMAISGINISFGGTSLLIAVGVSLETMKQIESHLLMRHYEGFMK